jgi:FkbM family methyltransferase
MDRYYKFLCEESKREYPGTLDGCVNLFGHKFGGPDYREVIELINEVVVLNQYHPDQFLLKDSIIIDAGANIGMFSALAAHIALYGHVYAFEPVEKTFQALKKNMEYYPQVICEKTGLGNKNLKKNIIVDSRGTAGSVFEDSPYYHGESNVGKNGKPELVQVIAIDDFIISHAIPRVDFIKIDTEGYEANILQGSKETIKKFHPVIAMSAYHNPSDKIELPKLLKSICPEYVCELHEKGGEDLICYIKS